MVADFHNDFLTSQEALGAFKACSRGNNRIVCALFRGKRDLNDAESLCLFFDKHKTSDMVLAFEDFGYGGDLSVLDEKLLSWRPLYVGLTWNGENDLAYGARTSGGVSERGLRLIKILNERKIAVDLAHLCRESLYDVIDHAERVVCSHTCFSAVRAHFRNLGDDELRLIVEKGGLIGLTLYSDFLTENGNGTIEDVYKHIDHFISHFGADHLAIGTDFYGCDRFPEGFCDYSFEEILTDYLLRKNYPSLIIEKILHKNLDHRLRDFKVSAR